MESSTEFSKLHSSTSFSTEFCLRLVISFMICGFDMLYQQAGSPLVDKFSKLGGKVCNNSIEAGKGQI